MLKLKILSKLNPDWMRAITHPEDAVKSFQVFSNELNEGFVVSANRTSARRRELRFNSISMAQEGAG
jgi:hypothetical protein